MDAKETRAWRPMSEAPVGRLVEVLMHGGSYRRTKRPDGDWKDEFGGHSCVGSAENEVYSGWREIEREPQSAEETSALERCITLLWEKPTVADEIKQLKKQARAELDALKDRADNAERDMKETEDCLKELKAIIRKRRAKGDEGMFFSTQLEKILRRVDSEVAALRAQQGRKWRVRPAKDCMPPLIETEDDHLPITSTAPYPSLQYMVDCHNSHLGHDPADAKRIADLERELEFAKGERTEAYQHYEEERTKVAELEAQLAEPASEPPATIYDRVTALESQWHETMREQTRLESRLADLARTINTVERKSEERDEALAWGQADTADRLIEAMNTYWHGGSTEVLKAELVTLAVEGKATQESYPPITKPAAPEVKIGLRADSGGNP